MRPFGAFLFAAGVAAALMLPAGASLAAASGDTCTASGGNGMYALHINVAPNTAQYGFAFGAPGVTIKAVTIPGANGDFAEGSKPKATNGQWLSDTPFTGAVDVSLSTSGAVTGPIKIVPGSSGFAHYWSPVTCKMTAQTGVKGLKLTVDPKVIPFGNGWRLGVTVPSSGTVTASQLVSSISSSSAKGALAKSFVHGAKVFAANGGHVLLTLRPTAAGMSMLAAGSPLKVMVRVAFDAQTGGSASKTLHLTLRHTQV